MIARGSKYWLLAVVALLMVPALPARAQMGYRAQAFRAAAAQRKADRKARNAADAAADADTKDVRPDDAKPAGAAGGSKPGAGKGQPTARSMEGLPPKWIEQLRDRSPEEQQ